MIKYQVPNNCYIWYGCNTKLAVVCLTHFLLEFEGAAVAWNVAMTTYAYKRLGLNTTIVRV